MAANLCCTAPRCMTPTEPILKHAFKPGNHQISAIPGATDSRYTSTKSEDLREIQQLFDQGNLADSAACVLDEQSFNSSSVSSKHSKLTSFFRRRMSRKLSKFKVPQSDAEKLKQAKDEIRTNLLNEQGPDAGGYDADAAVLDDVDEQFTPCTDAIDEPSRGRPKTRGQPVQYQTWPGPLGHSRHSLSLTPPKISLGSRANRRSHSMTSLLSPPDSPTPMAMRLPSFSVDRDSSHTWKRGVMESLHIDSPSSSALVSQPIRHGGIKEFDPAQWPLREMVMTPDSEVLLIQAPPPSEPPNNDEYGVAGTSTRQSEDIYETSWPKQSFDRGIASHSGSCSSSSGVRPHFFMRPERRPNRSSAASVHLYSMGISRHLRSTSSFRVGAPRSQPDTRAAPTRLQEPKDNNPKIPKSGFAAGELPALPSNTLKFSKDNASSAYSSKVCSRRSSRSGQKPTLDDRSQTKSSPPRISPDLSKETMSINTKNRCIGLQTPKMAPLTLPDNPSVSSLGEMSTKSSKISRFKENFESNDVKKSKKRASVINLFSKTRRHKSESVSSFDGVLDEPRRLQRAMALTDQNDAAGLLAKAIREKQAEKSSLYLEGNKEAAQHDIFRQRSSSFCGPRGDSLKAQQDIGVNPSQLTPDWHRRSTSETFLKPEGSITGSLFTPEMSTQRAYNTSHLTPDFMAPVFSDPAYPTSDTLSVLPARNLSISIEPTAACPVDTGDAPRRPSFQLNDVPAVLDTPTSSVKFKAPITAVESVVTRTVGDIGDSSLDLGPWSRYPSHTREQRNGSAGIKDNVKTHDFAYDLNPLNIVTEGSDNDVSGPKHRKRSKKKKKRLGTLPKSKSMMFGRNLIVNYTKLFRSSSVEWLHHGRGHRSSISAGGSLEHPELEILPPMFAPLPFIPDKRKRDEVEDPGLAPGEEEIELKQFRLRRLDHGHSFVDGSTPSPSRMDGSAEVKGGATPKSYQREETRRVASSPALVGRLTAADGSTITSSLAYARHYESCVYLPPSTSHSTASRHLNFIQGSEYHRITSGGGFNSPDLNLIDKMLASQPTSTNITPLPSPLASPLLAPMQSIAETAIINKNRRGHSKSVSSVTSLRASSMDLLKTLKEAEECERQRALEGLLSKARKSLSEDRKISSEISVKTTVERAEPVIDKHEAQGLLGQGHNTWPGAFRSGIQSSSTEVEAI